MYAFADRVKDTTTTTGTGDITLAGAPPTGYRAFNAAGAFVVGQRCYYTISSASGSEWESGLGTLTGATTLARTAVLASSNSNNAVSFSAGTKDVFCSIPADWVNRGMSAGQIEMARLGAFT